MDQLRDLYRALGSKFQALIEKEDDLIEVVMDLGRPFQLRYPDGVIEYSDVIITQRDIDNVCKNLTNFGPDNRAGLDGCLHRISRIIARDGHTVIGLTCRIGKPIPGSEKLIQDLLDQGKSILIVGRPGSGKTSLLRSCSNYLSVEKNRNVIIVDTSDEIAGSGNIPHASVGRARKMPVPQGRTQDQVLLEAVENHLPNVIIVDEISDLKEVDSVLTIGRRGVQILATCHGNVLQDVVDNKTLKHLLGGVKDVAISDENAKLNGGRKTKLERTFPSAFDVVVEIKDFDYINLYLDVDLTVDMLLHDGAVFPEERRLIDGKVKTLNPFVAKAVRPVLQIPTTHGREKTYKK